MCVYFPTVNITTICFRKINIRGAILMTSFFTVSFSLLKAAMPATLLFLPCCYFKKRFLIIRRNYYLKFNQMRMRIIQDTISGTDISCIPTIKITGTLIIVHQLINNNVNSIKVTCGLQLNVYFSFKVILKLNSDSHE